MSERKKSIITQRKISIPASVQTTSETIDRKLSCAIRKISTPINIVVQEIPKIEEKSIEIKVVQKYFQVCK